MKKVLTQLKKIQNNRPIRIVFICTANCCRSPLAEILFENLLKNEIKLFNKNFDEKFIIESAGTDYSGFRISDKTALLLVEEEKIAPERCSSHLGRSITEIEEPDLVLTMTYQHTKDILNRIPYWKDRVFVLDDFVKIDSGRMPKDIIDPAGCPIASYRKMKDHIKKDLLILLKLIKAEGLI